MLELSKASKVFRMFSVGRSQFLVHYEEDNNTHGYITDTMLIFASNEFIRDVIISSYFYEAICRTGAPLSFITDNIDAIQQFISKIFKIQFTFFSPNDFEIKKSTIHSSINQACILEGDNGTYLIGNYFNVNIIFKSDMKYDYHFICPKLTMMLTNFSNVSDTDVQTAVYWIMLACLDFYIGYGDNFKNHNIKMKGIVDTNYYDADTLQLSNKWFKTPKFTRILLEDIGWNGTIETAKLAAKYLNLLH